MVIWHPDHYRYVLSCKTSFCKLTNILLYKLNIVGWCMYTHRHILTNTLNITIYINVLIHLKHTQYNHL